MFVFSSSLYSSLLRYFSHFNVHLLYTLFQLFLNFHFRIFCCCRLSIICTGVKNRRFFVDFNFKIVASALSLKLIRFTFGHSITNHFFLLIRADSCTNIKSVGKPVTHNTRYYQQGAWMKDPLGIMGAGPYSL